MLPSTAAFRLGFQNPVMVTEVAPEVVQLRTTVLDLDANPTVRVAFAVTEFGALLAVRTDVVAAVGETVAQAVGCTVPRNAEFWPFFRR